MYPAVELRDQFTDATGPLPDDHPATIVISVARSLVASLGVDAVRDLVKAGASEFDAATGYIHGSGSAGGLQSPFERRGSGTWNEQRLDSVTRGVHWGNLIGAGHLAAIGGLDRLQQLQTTGGITRLEPWSNPWWFEVAADPFGPCNDHADTIAERLPEISPFRP